MAEFTWLLIPDILDWIAARPALALACSPFPICSITIAISRHIALSCSRIGLEVVTLRDIYSSTYIGRDNCSNYTF